MVALFLQSELEAIATAPGSEIEYLLQTCGMVDWTPHITKRHRLYNAFAKHQSEHQERRAILAFIRKAIKPALYDNGEERRTRDL